MNLVFIIHLIAITSNAIFIILLWWYNHKLVTFNYQLMKDNREILIEAKKIQDRMNDLESRMPGTIWQEVDDTGWPTGKAHIRVEKKDK